MSGILVVIELREGRISRISLEALAAAQALLKHVAASVRVKYSELPPVCSDDGDGLLIQQFEIGDEFHLRSGGFEELAASTAGDHDHTFGREGRDGTDQVLAEQLV